MKYSQFNSLVAMNGGYALFNALHQKVTFLETELYHVLTRAIKDGIGALKDVHPDFYTYLLHHGYVVDDDVDEVGIVKQLSRKVNDSDSTFLLIVNLNMMCNFRCYYCYETHANSARVDKNTLEKIKAFISRTVHDSRLKSFQVSFFGGEPLLYFKKDVVPIMDHYIGECRSTGLTPDISFTTNGYCVNKYFVDYFKGHDIRCSLQITLDGYRKKHDLVRFTGRSKKGSYDEIIRNIYLLVTNMFFVRVRINYTDENLDDILKVAEDLLDIPSDMRLRFLVFDFHRVWQNDRKDDTSKVLAEQMERICSFGFHVSSKYLPNNVIKPCYADRRNSVVINYNGNIYKCTARDFTEDNRGGVIDENGKLIWKDGYIERRMDSKFKNIPCLECRVMPICNGGCSQHALEHLDGREYCIYFGDELEKDMIIKAKLSDILGRTDGALEM